MGGSDRDLEGGKGVVILNKWATLPAQTGMNVPFGDSSAIEEETGQLPAQLEDRFKVDRPSARRLAVLAVALGASFKKLEEFPTPYKRASFVIVIGRGQNEK
jgi:hypothetical protein